MGLDTVKNILVILSGKGGVGKSTVSTQISIALRDLGFKVGLLDIDLCGPSVPHLLHIDQKEVHQSEQGWVPVYVDDEQKLAVMSIAFLLNSKDDAVVWRGPKKTGMIRQFLSDVVWGDIDYLVIDTPPGTSDEHITLVENIRDKSCAAILVTTPQLIAVDDARRQLTFCKKTKLPVLGVVENMSGFVCPSCLECTYLFSSGGGAALAELGGVPLLGRLPIDPTLTELADRGESLLTHAPESLASTSLKDLANSITNLLTNK